MSTSPTQSPATSSTSQIPRSFYLLLPLGIALSWSNANSSANMVLRTLELAKTMPDQVFLLPTLLRHMSPEAVSGGVTTVLTFVGGAPGSTIAFVSDRLGLKTTVGISVAVLICGNLLSAWPRTFLIGIPVSTGASVAATPVFTAIFASQTNCERTRQKIMTIQYGVLSCTTLLATLTAGVLPFWACYVQAAALLSIGLALEMYEPHRPMDSDVSTGETTASPLEVLNRLQVIGFAILSIFTVLHSTVLGQYLGSSLLVFAKEQIRPIGGFQVPAQWFLSLSSLMNLLLSYPLAWFYDSVANVKFHVKLRASITALVFACGLITVAVQASPPGAVPPYMVALAVALASVAEMHWAPVMVTVISSTMPKHMVGVVNSIYFCISGCGSMLAGFGVPIYAAMGPEHFFFALTCIAGVSSLLFYFAFPTLSYCFDGEAQGECMPLDPGKQL